ncbi:MAG TPA: hypothetical protein PLZ09_03490 [Clostridia bacterium]|nr:hypothetical protein [Clostridia bacterium]
MTEKMIENVISGKFANIIPEKTNIREGVTERDNALASPCLFQKQPKKLNMQDTDCR